MLHDPRPATVSSDTCWKPVIAKHYEMDSLSCPVSPVARQKERHLSHAPSHHWETGRPGLPWRLRAGSATLTGCAAALRLSFLLCKNKDERLPGV